ncbi:MAG: hypothetical protein ABIO80_05595 [Sphingomicrobium sp.]
MQLARPLFAPDPRAFGRGRSLEIAATAPAAPLLSDDVKLFATTFLAGFVFVSIFLA